MQSPGTGAQSNAKGGKEIKDADPQSGFFILFTE